MELEELQKHWNAYGAEDPMWAILTVPELKGGKWDPQVFFQNGVGEIDKQMALIQSLDIEVHPGRALDFGCGVGRLTQALCNHFAECHGVDIAPSMIETARTFNQHGDKCHYHLNESDNLSRFPDNYFDFIYTVIVLQHMRPVYSRRYLQEFMRVLAPGGLLVFQLPSGLVNPQPAAPRQQAAPHHPTLRQRLWGVYGRFRRRLFPPQTPSATPKPFQPRMEMHAIPQEEVLTLLSQAGGIIKDIKQDSWAGPAWLSYTYYVAKP
ncbi:MAG: class I SAM-dependent methyltransferase [Ardenticatenaceae bacterium]|nr:class I SAM-dependent methyltransferase [Ardenticatenaceae bacterium]